MNTGGRRRAPANGAAGSTAAFLLGVTASQLQGCDKGIHGDGSMEFPSFPTAVLTVWMLAVGAYTWFWLCRPRLPSADVSTTASSAK